MKRIDMSGQKFGRLTVVKINGRKGKHLEWECKCECGQTVFAIATNLRRGKTQSCGCLRVELTRKRSTKHNAKKLYPREYKAWQHAKSRCYSKTNRKYEIYGKRGISMCVEWQNDFMKFYKHIGPAPDGTTLDRIDVNGNYEPGNVRWATPKQQANNTRSNIYVDENMTLMEFAESINQPYKKIYHLYRIKGMNKKQIEEYCVKFF